MADNLPTMFTVTEHVIDAQYIREYPNATVSQDSPLKLVVKKYTPTDNPNPQPGDVTIVGAHGCGLLKASAQSIAYTMADVANEEEDYRNFTSRYGKKFSCKVNSKGFGWDQYGLQMWRT